MDTSSEEQLLLHQNLPKWKRFLSVEPAMLFFGTAFGMSTLTLQNWLLQKDCEKWDFINNQCLSETDSQLQSSQEYSFTMILQSMLAVITAIVGGTMIDRNLKYLKRFIVQPVLAQILCDLLNCLNVLYLNLNAFTTAVYNALIIGTGGGIITFIASSSSYISHTSTKKERTIRLTYLLFTFNICAASGNFLAGYMIQYFGIVYSFLISLVLAIGGILLVHTFVETKDFTYSKDAKNRSFLVSMVEAVDVLRRRRPKNKRAIIITLFIIYGISCSYPVGESTVVYLFLRKQFNWNAFTYGIYSFSRNITKCLGSLTTAEVFKRLLDLSDTTAGLIGSISEMLMALSWFVVVKEWQICVALMFGIFEKSITSVTFSLASKCVEPHEYGRLSSIYGSSNILIPLAILTYNGLYALTISSYPEAIFLLTATLCLIMIVLFSYLLHLTRKEPLFTAKKFSSTH